MVSVLIYGRVDKKQKRIYVKTPIFIEPKDWDTKSKKIKNSFKDAASLNRHLQGLVSKLMDFAIEEERNGKNVTPELLNDLYTGGWGGGCS